MLKKIYQSEEWLRINIFIIIFWVHFSLFIYLTGCCCFYNAKNMSSFYLIYFWKKKNRKERNGEGNCNKKTENFLEKNYANNQNCTFQFWFSNVYLFYKIFIFFFFVFFLFFIVSNIKWSFKKQCYYRFVFLILWPHSSSAVAVNGTNLQKRFIL